jgi:hypothetical protein
MDAINKYPTYPISIAGGKYSHGGQTMLNGSIYLDMKDYNNIIKLDTSRKIITVSIQVKQVLRGLN